MSAETTTTLSPAMIAVLVSLAERDGWHTIYRFRRSSIDALITRGLIERGDMNPVLVRRTVGGYRITVTEYDFTIRLTGAGSEALR